MKTRRFHRLVGFILLLPLIGWTTTGLVFFIKPGYQGAYEQLAIKTYDLEEPLVITPEPGWSNITLSRSILGRHLLVTTRHGPAHLDPDLMMNREYPSEQEIQQLIEDATGHNRSRYGKVVSVTGNRVTTDTGVDIFLNWSTLTLNQEGPDTRMIDSLYRIHYLQWTASPMFNSILGTLGLVLLTVLALVGLKLGIRRKPRTAAGS